MARDPSERFPRVIAGPSELPVAFATCLAPYLNGHEKPAVILMVPRVALLGVNRGWRAWVRQLLPWHMSPEMVIVRTGAQFIVAAAATSGATPTVTSIAPPDLISVELGWILLLAWFKLQHVDNGGVACTTVYFNTVGIEHFRRFMFDLNAACAAPTQAETDVRNRNALEGMPFKFKNIIGQRLLAKEEQIEAALFRPPARKRAFRLSRFLPGLALVLTEARLLIASEDEGSTHQATSYGMSATFIARDRVKTWRMTGENDKCTLNLEYGLQDAVTTLSLDFPAPMNEEIVGLMRRICPQQPNLTQSAAAVLQAGGSATLR